MKNKKILFIICFILLIVLIIFSKSLAPKKLTEEEEKLLKLDNIHLEISYFHKSYTNRYLNYKEKNPNLSNLQIIKNVNMNLDKDWYFSTPAQNLYTKEILVNKYYHLEKDYVPNNLEFIDTLYASSGMRLVKEAKDAFEKLAYDASLGGLTIIAMSSYRSYDYQKKLYNQYVEKDGVEKADTYSARPGYSEHQTGLAVDIYNKKEDYNNFQNTEEYEWMQKHAHEYGFILRFPKGKEKETGYQFEAWHYRYVGVDIATNIKKQNITLEEYIACK